MVAYRLFLADGSDLGPLTQPVFLRLGEEILTEDGQRFRVLDVIPIEQEKSPFVGLLQVELVQPHEPSGAGRSALTMQVTTG